MSYIEIFSYLLNKKYDPCSYQLNYKLPLKKKLNYKLA